jgi:hypothetical protein
MPKKRGPKRRHHRAGQTPPWRDSIDPTDPKHQPRGHTDSLHFALRLLELEEDEQEVACKEICEIAERYNSTAAVAVSAPRFKAVETRLLALRRAYAALAQQLSCLDSATLNQIHDPRSRANQRLYQLAGAEWIREPHIRTLVQRDSLALEFESPLIRAEAMTEYLGQVIDVFRRGRKTNRGAVDRGGKENIFRSTYGHEKLSLVRECANVFDKYGLGNLITRTETGPFFRFVSHLYDFAVGKEADGGSRGLADPIRQCAREYKEETAKAVRLAAMWGRSR